MNIPIMLAVLGLVTGGIARFFWKLASENKIYGPSYMLVQELGIILVFVIAHIVQRHPFSLPPRIGAIALLGGTLLGIGVLGVYHALRLGGQGSILFPIAALTVIVSVPLTFIVYKEPITVTKLVGLGLGVGSIIFLAR